MHTHTVYFFLIVYQLCVCVCVCVCVCMCVCRSVLCGPASSSVFIDSCTDCTIVVACQQVSVHREGRWPTFVHREGRWPTFVHREGRWPTFVHREGRWPTFVHREGRWPTFVHREGRWPTFVHREGRWPTFVHHWTCTRDSFFLWRGGEGNNFANQVSSSCKFTEFVYPPPYSCEYTQHTALCSIYM